MDSGKKQTQTNQTGTKPDNGKADARKQTDAKLALKNRRSEANLQRRRATISRELEKTNKLLDEVRSRIKDKVPEFDEDDLAEYRVVLEVRTRDLAVNLALSEVEYSEDEEYEGCAIEDSEDEDDGASICLKARPESLHEDRNGTFDDIEAADETSSNLEANSDEYSDSDDGVSLANGKGVKPDHSLNDECF
ncbi:hypothetical protein CEP53_010224 [Fusarium sp. AF-6]|nr:hypothetical protein CEP53_010224 [Fusarium sp. AF-6]